MTHNSDYQDLYTKLKIYDGISSFNHLIQISSSLKVEAPLAINTHYLAPAPQTNSHHECEDHAWSGCAMPRQT